MRHIFSNRPKISGLERFAFTGAGSIPIIYGFTHLAINRFNGQSGSVWMWILLLVIVLLFFGLNALGLVERARTRRLLSETEYRLCVNCRYVLTALADQGVCLECGANYDLKHQVAEWRDAYRVH